MLIGTGEINITPKKPVTMGGYGDRKGKSKGTLDPIYARTILFKDHYGNEAAIVAVEVIDFSGVQVERMKESISRKTGISKENIIIAATHTHSGPLTRDDPVMGRSSSDYMEWLMESVPKTVSMAVHNLKECKIGWYQGEFGEIGASRRDANGSGKPLLTIIGFTDMKDRLLGALFNYNCHPTVLSGENLQISADYPGAAISMLERVYGSGVKFIFTNGACGDISTRFMRRSQSYGEVKRLGSILGAEVIKGLNKIEYKEGCTLSMKERVLSLVPRELSDKEEIEGCMEELKRKLEELKERGAADGEIRIAETAYQGAVVQGFMKDYSELLEYDGVISALRLGDGVIAAVPGELFSCLGNDIIKSSPFRYSMVMGYANGYLGYIPDEVSYDEGGYEALSCRFAKGEGERLRDSVISLVKELD